MDELPDTLRRHIVVRSAALTVLTVLTTTADSTSGVDFLVPIGLSAMAGALCVRQRSQAGRA